MESGRFVLIFHTHLPWVLHHGERPHGVDWLNEAVAECYIPLLNVLNDFFEQGTLPKVSLDLSPVLCEQLEHPDFPVIFENYCIEKIKAAQKDKANFRRWGYDPHQIYLTDFWRKWYEERLSDFKIKYKSSIIRGFRNLQDAGAIEILTCAATHAYLPLLGDDRSVELQIKLAVENYKKYFGRNPRGIWLPECAYRPSYTWHTLIPVEPYHTPRLRPGLEQVLAKYGIKYFIIDQNILQRARPLGAFIDLNREKFVPYELVPDREKKFELSPLRLFNVSSSEQVEYGTAIVFTRHQSISMQVWSGEIGYPAEPDYLDFHKRHLESYLRYWRVTDSKADMMYKSLYHPEWIAKKIDLQSNHFIHHIENTLNWYYNQTGYKGTLCTPFDTELFGHWWFEGPEFVRAVIRGLSFSPYVRMTTCSEEIFRLDPKEVIAIPEGSWGVNNNHDVWSNPETYWTWESIYNGEKRLSDFYQKYIGDKFDVFAERLLKQTLREFLLLQASDWQFLIYTKSARDYAEQRFWFHNSDFNRLMSILEKYIETREISSEEQLFLTELENRDSLFDELDVRWWSVSHF